MSLPGQDTAGTEGGSSSPPRDHKCSLPALYESAEKFNIERKKSNFRKLCRTSFEEARQLLEKNQSGGISAINTPANTEAQQPASMADFLHHSLLMGSLVPLEQLARTQQRLTQVGIPPPVHTFPYGFRTDEPLATPTTPTYRTRTKSYTFRKLLLASVTPDRLDFEDKSIRFFSEPGKQFLDLVDLEWRFFKGLAKWGRVPRKVPFMDINFTSEKRFVESQGMPGLIFPPLVRKTMVIYPQIECHKEGHFFLKWNA